MSCSNKIILLILASAVGLSVAPSSEAAWLRAPTAAANAASASILETVKKKRSWSRLNNSIPALKQKDNQGSSGNTPPTAKAVPTLKQGDDYQGSGLGKRDCGEGYVALDKPNKYGAYCEQRAVATCPKGYLGTPPNCEYCPNGKTKEGICFF
jgi:hypothetical protein